jgi:hypothetical protein
MHVISGVTPVIIETLAVFQLAMVVRKAIAC